MAGPLQGFTLEIFAGTATLSRSLSSAGFESLGLDGPRNRFKPLHQTLTLDLASEQGQELLWEVLSHPRLCYVHMAPPCGTASLAREVPLPEYLKQQGVVEPRPLTSKTKPWGLDDLEGVDLIKVEAANTLYKLTAEVANRCLDRGLLFSIEKPRGSTY